MKFPIRASVFLVLSTFLCVEIAQARLLRFSGRGSLSREFSETWYYVDNQFIDEFGNATFDVSSGSTFVSSKAVGGGGPGVNAVPSDPCIASFTQAQVDSAIADVEDQIRFLQNSFTGDDAIDDEIERQLDDLDDQFLQLESGFPFGNDPCVWEFEEGEDLFTFGSFGPFDSDDIGYDVSWMISGNGVSESLAGAIQDGPNPNDPSVQDGWVTLDAPAPTSLVPGDYFLSVSVSLLPPLNQAGEAAGQFFYESSDPSWPVSIQEICPFSDAAGTNICGFNSIDDRDELVTARTSFSSDTEILRIIAADTPPDDEPVLVPAPSTFAALLAGLLVLVRGRRRIAGVPKAK